MVKVILNGASGAMGKVVADIISADPDMEVVVGVDRRADMDAAFPIMDSINKVNVAADVVIDFSSVEAADTLLDFIEQKKIPAVICTTGLSEAQIDRINELSSVSPILRSANMSLGINTLSKVLAQIAPTLRAAGFDIEIVEAHHRRKLDAPSGTAVKTAELISKVRTSKQQGAADEEESLAGARGATFDGMRIHSVRLPGLVAHQEVIFGSQGEGLTLRHDSYDRVSFMTGVNLSIKEVVKRSELVYGLEHLL